MPQESRVSVTREIGWGEISALARSRGWVVLRMVKAGEMATVSHDFLQSLLSLEPLHHGASVLTSTILNKRLIWWARSFGTNGTTKQGSPAKSGLSLCTVTNAHHHCFELFCLMRNYLFFFFFFFFCFYFLSKPNMLLISCML